MLFLKAADFNYNAFNYLFLQIHPEKALGGKIVAYARRKIARAFSSEMPQNDTRCRDFLMCIQFFAEASFTNNSVSYYTIKQVSTCGENRKKGILLQPAYTSALCSLHRSNCPRKIKREKCRCTAWMICRHFHFVSLPTGSCSQQAHCSLKNYLDNEIYWLCQLSDELLGASDSDLKPVSLNLNSVFKVTI